MPQVDSKGIVLFLMGLLPLRTIVYGYMSLPLHHKVMLQLLGGREEGNARVGAEEEVYCLVGHGIDEEEAEGNGHHRDEAHPLYECEFGYVVPEGPEELDDLEGAELVHHL